VGDDKTLPSPEFQQRASALRTLASAFLNENAPGGEATRKAISVVLSKAARDADSHVRATAALEAGRLGPADGSAILNSLLDSDLTAVDGAAIRFGAAVGASRLGDEAGYPILKRLIEQGDTNARSVAAAVSGGLRQHGAELLTLAVQHSESKTDLAVIEAATQLPDTGEAVIEPLAANPDAEVRQAVMHAARSFPTGDRLLALGAKDTDPDVAHSAVQLARDWADAEAAKPPDQRDEKLILRLRAIDKGSPLKPA
jgi:HEAT repeat protein